jgi:hypothetical protein
MLSWQGFVPLESELDHLLALIFDEQDLRKMGDQAPNMAFW